jgi:ABC-type lipoprotein release transport system permease subunit
VEAYENPEGIPGMKKGRVPLYENELIVTGLTADMLELSIGDEVEVSYGTVKKTFLVSGIYQSGSDSGACFGMSFAAAKYFQPSNGWGQRYYLLDNRAKTAEIVQDLEERFGDNLNVKGYKEGENPVEGQYGVIVTALKAIIYVFSLVFAFVVVRMVCTRSFLQERTDIGVLKAIGFTSGKLRLGFAFRFAFVALLGSGIGILCSVLFSEKLLGVLLGVIGMNNVVFDFSVAAVAVPIVVVTGCFFAFAYLAANKVKRVEVRELVTE